MYQDILGILESQGLAVLVGTLLSQDIPVILESVVIHLIQDIVEFLASQEFLVIHLTQDILA